MEVRRRAGAAALTALGWCAFSGAAAQIVDDVADIAPIQWGPVQFFPVLTTDLEWTDNLYYASTDEVRTGSSNALIEPVPTISTSLSPSIIAELPFGQSRARFGYAYRYRDYSTETLPPNGSHYFEAEVRLVSSRGFLIQLRDDFQRGVLDTETFDPGGAVRFDGQPFKSNSASAGFGYQGRRYGVLLTGYVNVVSFPDDRIAAYYDTDSWTGELAGEYALTERIKLMGSYSIGRTKLSRPIPPTNFVDQRLELETGTRLGGDFVLGPASSLRVRLGRPTVEYISLFPDESKSLTADVAFQHNVPAGLQVGVNLNRNTYAAVYSTANYYTDGRLGVSLSNDSRAKVVVGGSLTYYFNRYPSAPSFSGGPSRRVDQTFEGTGWVAYRASGRMEWRFFARTENRSSNQFGFSYRVKSVGAAFTFGG